jgi:hypothetical protein
MAQVSFTKRELNRGKVVDPAWYRIKIETVGEAPAKASEKGPSTNYPVEGTILFNGDTGDTTFREIPLDWNFNSKAMGFAVGFLQAFGVEVKEGVRYDLKSAEGREIDVFVDNDVYNNRPINKVNHKYRVIRTDVQPVTAQVIS